MDAKKIKQRLRGEADRKAHTLHLSEAIFNEFKKSCAPYSASRVIEEMMKEYLESLKAEEARPKKKASKKKNLS